MGQHAQANSPDPTGLVILEINPDNGDFLEARKINGIYTASGNNVTTANFFSFMRNQVPLGSYLRLYSEFSGVIAILDNEGQYGVWPMINGNNNWTIYQPNIFAYPLLASQRVELTGGEAYSDFNADINWLNYGKQVVAGDPIRPLYVRSRIPIGNYVIPN
jgi:hypothetical protein